MSVTGAGAVRASAATLRTVDAAVGYRFGALSDNLSDFTASLKIANIMDNRQINDFGGLQSATPTPIYWAVAGRSIFVNLSASLD